MINLHFFTFAGSVLIVVALLSTAVRPRDPRSTGLLRIINRQTISALIFVLAGVLAILVGTGRVPLAFPGQ